MTAPNTIDSVLTKVVNPDHMEAIDPDTHRRMRKTPRETCLKGHEFTPENTAVYPNGKRRCKICRRASDRVRDANRRERRRIA